MLSRVSGVRRDESGLAGTILIIAIAWALSAVLMLTGTLISAQQINNRVDEITGEVGPIDKDLDAVALAEETNAIAADILTAAKPLSGQLDQVIDSVGGINGSVDGILETAGSINRTANSINSVVGSIGSAVDSIDGNLSAVLATVRSIDAGVGAINGRADTVVSIVAAIRSDLADVLAQVGSGHGAPSNSTIHGHANSIDCSPAVAPQSSACGD